MGIGVFKIGGRNICANYQCLEVNATFKIKIVLSLLGLLAKIKYLINLNKSNH